MQSFYTQYKIVSTDFATTLECKFWKNLTIQSKKNHLFFIFESKNICLHFTHVAWIGTLV